MAPIQNGGRRTSAPDSSNSSSTTGTIPKARRPSKDQGQAGAAAANPPQSRPPHSPRPNGPTSDNNEQFRMDRENVYGTPKTEAAEVANLRNQFRSSEPTQRNVFVNNGSDLFALQDQLNSQNDRLQDEMESWFNLLKTGDRKPDDRFSQNQPFSLDVRFAKLFLKRHFMPFVSGILPAEAKLFERHGSAAV